MRQKVVVRVGDFEWWKEMKGANRRYIRTMRNEDAVDEKMLD